MRFARGFVCFALIMAQLVAIVPHAQAESQSGIVISEMFPGATGTATQEFIELFNNSSNDIDISDYCLSYISSTGATITKLACFTPTDETTTLWLKSGGYAIAVSNEYKGAYPSVAADAYFNGGISATAGHIKLADAFNNEIDRLGWGAAANPEGLAVTAPANTKALQRIGTLPKLQDTDNNASDFFQILPTLHSTSVYEVVTIVDLCSNIPGPQSTIPVGYALDDASTCQSDSCVNIDGLQTSVPDLFDADAQGNCIEHDECRNLAGVQSVVPANMRQTNDSNCEWDVQPLVITELLPNADGSDTGNEFIEVYNPTNTMIDLSIYSISVGINSDKVYAFPLGATIAPGEYRSFSDSVMKFTLVNTTSRVLLHAIDGSLLSDTGVYDSPLDGESWAMINGSWQYTNNPTPGAENIVSTQEVTVIDTTDAIATACPEGKYRNPLTNRCRTITVDAAVLATCDVDQYRNPETGRCKKIDASVLTPCKDGQYRSEETNRCRNITTASTQKPCKDNQYRSEETNRCRTVVSNTIPAAAFAVKSTKDSTMTFVGWAALAAVAAAAIGYALWEWRYELRSVMRTMLGRFSK